MLPTSTVTFVVMEWYLFLCVRCRRHDGSDLGGGGARDAAERCTEALLFSAAIVYTVVIDV